MDVPTRFRHIQGRVDRCRVLYKCKARGQSGHMSAINFRANEHDEQLLAKLQHQDESIADVIRRALAALDRIEWERDAQQAARTIMTSGENLGDEPDEW